MLASAKHSCSPLSLAKALAESMASAGDLLRSWKERASQVNECKRAARERYQACLSTLCGTASTPKWKMPVFHRKSGRNSPAIPRRKRIRSTRIMNLNRCVRRSQSFHRLAVFDGFFSDLRTGLRTGIRTRLAIWQRQSVPRDTDLFFLSRQFVELLSHRLVQLLPLSSHIDGCQVDIKVERASSRILGEKVELVRKYATSDNGLRERRAIDLILDAIVGELGDAGCLEH